MKKVQRNMKELKGLVETFYIGQSTKEDLIKWEKSLLKMQRNLQYDKHYRIDVHAISFLEELGELEMTYLHFKAVYMDYLVVYHPEHHELRNISPIEAFKTDVFKRLAYDLLNESVEFLNQSSLEGASKAIDQVSKVIDIERSNKFTIVLVPGAENISSRELNRALRNVRKYISPYRHKKWYQKLTFCLKELPIL
ncbi:hypothetical protein FOL75_05050 [Bacillus thuringiensis]|uniref:hypothetical protein n=1 Tax=Bacillus thuringiensis TaxID=1428 RepID=UPI002853F36D|nr:hypothetical protein [Bacillus thuringiensis]MDR5021435.1 hypothetical protein [Bacillus thuringiensis]